MPEPARLWRLGLVAFAGAAAFAVRPPALSAQSEDLLALQQQCRGASAQLETVCGEGALALQAGQGMVGLLAAGGGAQIPGAASTFGRRFGGTPRFSLAIRGGIARLGGPDVEGGTLPGGGSSFGYATRVTLAVGLLDGFSVLPTVGGLLSLDVFTDAGLVSLPEGRGFQGGSTSYGVGASLGLLRESFTLPGVTVSVARHGVGDLQLGDRAAGDVIQVDFDPGITSIRGVIGKDLLHLGILAGAGWDRYEGDGTLEVSGVSAVSVSGFTTTRRLYFGGASLNLLLLQLSAEAGWAGGLAPLAARHPGGYDPTGGSLFLSVAGRLTL
jgi:hypothetical protein